MNNINKIKKYMAGYILKAAKKSPLRIKRKDLCKPQPGQGKLSICLEKHGSILSDFCYIMV